MGLLQTEPEGVVQSLPELMAIANAMEDESALRYRQLSERMRSLDNDAAMKVFDHLAQEEEKHSAKVVELSWAVTGAPPKRTDIRWELPHDLEDEGMANLAVSHLVTPYRALSIAVRNEERAFAFWSYVSAYAPSQLVREYAERMAREELRHASILRKERRSAYHHAPRLIGVPIKIFMAQLHEKAASLEHEIVAKCKALAQAAAQENDLATADLLGRIAQEAAEGMQAADRGEGHPFGAEEVARNPVEILDRMIAACEGAAETYLQAAEVAVDEAPSLEAQRLSKSAIARLVALRERRAELSPIPFEDAPDG